MTDLGIAVIVCILLFHTTTGANFNKKQSGTKDISRSDLLIDCTKFKTDYDIRASFPFEIVLNPISESSKITYGYMDANDSIYYLNIANEEYVPSSVFCFKHLKKLYIRRTIFHDGNGGLPAAIERLAPTLTDLGIYNVIITHLPEQIGKLKHLESLVLSNTGLITLPDSIGNLSSLNFLHLPYNKLTSLPTIVLKIPLLWQLVLSHNPYLRSIKSINGHRYLEILQTDNCPIEQIPVNLPQLTDLYMFNNNLTDLVDIRTLGNETESGKYFDFDKNYIQFVPPQIQYVKNLHSLKLDNNKLKMLPSDIFSIKTLDYLYIRNNSFNGIELQAIVTKFNITNPSLKLCYSSKNTSSVKC